MYVSPVTLSQGLVCQLLPWLLIMDLCHQICHHSSGSYVTCHMCQCHLSSCVCVARHHVFVLSVIMCLCCLSSYVCVACHHVLCHLEYCICVTCYHVFVLPVIMCFCHLSSCAYHYVSVSPVTGCRMACNQFSVGSLGSTSRTQSIGWIYICR